MSTPHESDPFPFNDRLRSMYGADEVPDPSATPPLKIWAGIQAQLPPAAPIAAPPRRSPLWAGIGGLILGVVLMLLVGWWRQEPAQTVTVVSPRAALTLPAPPVVTPAPELVKAPALPMKPEATVVAPTPAVRKSGPTAPVRAVAEAVAPPQPVAASTPAPAAGNGPGTVNLLPSPVPAVLVPLVQTETTLAGLGADTARTTRERRREALLAQRAALTKLRYRTDSLLLGLGEWAVAVEAPADSTPPAPLRNRWSIALAFAPERNFFGLGAPATDTLSAMRRTHEQGRGGYNAAVLAEYQLDRRLSVAAGLGLTSYGAELRLTEQRTTVSTKIDTMTAVSTHLNTVETKAYILRNVPDSVLAPILDFNNQLIGYHYLHTTRLDTVWTYLTNTEAVTTTTTTYTPTVTTRQELMARVLKPNYRFLTVPVLVRYRLGRATDWTASPTAPRWWADIAVGAQLQWFLGGTQAYTTDGLTYHTERVGPRGGPFRSFNLALTGAVALNYALTPRLSASLAPTLRYQVESVYKASTNLSQRPTATGLQVGLKLAF